MPEQTPTPANAARAAALAEIDAEAVTAMSAFPPFNSSHEGYAVILEELDELWDEVKANDIERSIEEAVQVGAMALRYIVDMRARYGFEAPPQPGHEPVEQATWTAADPEVEPTSVLLCGATGYWGVRNTEFRCQRPKGHDKHHENGDVIWFGDHAPAEVPGA